MAEVATKNVVTLSTTVSRDVTQDEITVTFETTQSAKDSNVVQENLSVFLGEALAQAKAAAEGNAEVQVETGSFNISPKYDKKGEIVGYYGSAELIVSGTDTKTISQLTGDIRVMRVSDVQHGISRKTRESYESEMTADAIEAFKLRALQYAKNFGFKGYTMLNANVGVNSRGYGGHRSGGARVMAMAASASVEMPVSAGKDTLTATVNGSIVLK